VSHSCDGNAAVYRETIRKARKLHYCHACRKVIRPGDYYASIAIVADGEAESVKRCGACQTTHLHLRELCRAPEHRYDDLWPDERLNCGESYEDNWGAEPPDEIADLPFISDDERGALLRPVHKEPT
jgi:hypothetical protein